MSQELTTEFVVSEVRKLQYLYGLKHEMRYGLERAEAIQTESVAEHLYGMHILAHYFLPLLDSDHKWNRSAIYEMITLHDIDEIKTGDVIGYLKSADMSAAEASKARVVISKSPLHMQEGMLSALAEYEAQETIESKFVKALDKFEPLIQVYCDNGRKVHDFHQTTSLQAKSIKEKPISAFPVMYSYYTIIIENMIKEGYFHD